MLHALADFIAQIAATNYARHCGYLLAIAATDLVTNQTANHCTGCNTNY